ncbi:maltokinase N-terminal cap-like domain-containing protein [Arthrobacter sp. H14]|uniref:maltokinase N-terminal cap-like domain-containing protein n=1 Tax=Arthrobacter sp. H14 TaxID=1312959 RepID=UPI0004B91F71|nr:phosphotransferase [Arthrobacter sp. H14]
MNQLQPPLPELLRSWLPGQRWYPAKGVPVSLRRVGGIRLQDPAGEVGLEVHLIAVDSGERVDVINVPLSYRSAPLEGAENGLVGEAVHSRGDDGDGGSYGSASEPGGGSGRRWIYDGAHDPVFVAAWLELMRTRSTTSDGRASGDGVPQFTNHTPQAGPAKSKVLTGEQSNTSAVIQDDTMPSIVKFFRVLSAGVNPDVEVGAGLTAAGCEEVPATYGWVAGRWHDPVGEFVNGEPSGALVEGQLSVLREFIGGSQDAWRLACRAALNGEDYTEQAEGLGRATAQVHLSLGKAFGTRAASPDERNQFVEGIIGRISWAWREAGSAVGPYDEQLNRQIDALRALESLPPLQRIHGDYHLGQVLHSERRGWVILDFEGEPLRTAAERSLADVPLRDVVGMLRSFEYVAGVVMHGDSGAGDGRDDGRQERAAGARQWSIDCSRAFIAGYQQETGEPLDTTSPLFVALWLDKALYEVVYELRNRPDWLSVPVSGVREALGDRGAVVDNMAAADHGKTDGHGTEEVNQ